jgi:hypothetical protein
MNKAPLTSPSSSLRVRKAALYVAVSKLLADYNRQQLPALYQAASGSMRSYAPFAPSTSMRLCHRDSGDPLSDNVTFGIGRSSPMQRR